MLERVHKQYRYLNQIWNALYSAQRCQAQLNLGSDPQPQPAGVRGGEKGLRIPSKPPPPQGFGFFPTNIVGLLLESFGDFKTLSVLRESAWERARYSVWLSRFLVTKERLVSHLQHVSTLLCCRTLKYTLLAENGINCVASWPCIFSCSVRQKHTTGRIKTPPQMKVAP